MKVKHGMHIEQRKYAALVRKNFQCKTEAVLTPRDKIKGMSYRRRAKHKHQLSVKFSICVMKLMLEKGGER